MTTAVETRGVLDVTERRDSLLALIKHARQQPVTTHGAQDLYSVTPWSGIGRNALEMQQRHKGLETRIDRSRAEGFVAHGGSPRKF
jgi:hypothetical protein